MKSLSTYAQQFASKGGKARAAKLSKARQAEIASTAAQARWINHVPREKARKSKRIKGIPKSFSAR